MQGGSSAATSHLNPGITGAIDLTFPLLLRSPELALSQQARFPNHPKTDFEGTGMSKNIYLFGFGGFAQKDFDRPTDCLFVLF